MLVIKRLCFIRLDGMAMKSKIRPSVASVFLSHLPTLGHLERLGNPISFASQYLPMGLWERTQGLGSRGRQAGLLAPPLHFSASALPRALQ